MLLKAVLQSKLLLTRVRDKCSCSPRLLFQHLNSLEDIMSFTSKLAAARTVVQGRAAERGVASAGRYASISAFNQNDEGIWRNGMGGYAPVREGISQHGLKGLLHYSKG